MILADLPCGAKIKNSIDPKELKIRKKLGIYYDLEQNYILLHITAKSRFLQKDVDSLEDIIQKVQGYLASSNMDKKLCIESPLCSKAKNKLETQSWEIL